MGSIIQKWEYREVVNPNQIVLDNLGDNGWELVAIRALQYETMRFIYVFKRMKI